ncbi:hypothetical protein Tco_0439964 [Tanacetum coccineum]
MTTLAEHIIVAGAENHPPMLEKSMYDSWESRILLFIKGKKNGRMMLDSIDEGLLVYPTVVGEDGQTRPKKYSELTEAQQLQDDYDVQATNIILHGIPPDVYSLSNHQEATKDIWDRVKLLMKGTEVSYQERECRLYNLFDNKFVTDVKLAKSLYTTNYDQLNAYLSQHERLANEVHIMSERYLDPLALVANSQTLYNPSQSPQHSVPSMHPSPQQFTPVYAAHIHHQHHHTPVNPLQQSVSPQPFISPSVTQQSQAKFPQLDSGLVVPTFQGITTTSRGNYAAGQENVVKCYNYLGKGHMVKHCTQPKRPRSSTWFKEKLMLVEAQEAGQILDEEQFAFIADPRIAEAQFALCPIRDNEITSDSNIIPYSQYLQESQDAVIQDTNSSTPNDLLVLSLVEKMTDHVANLDKENQTNKMVNESLTAELKIYKERVAIFEQRLNVDLNKREKLIDSQMADLIWNKNAKFAAF